MSTAKEFLKEMTSDSGYKAAHAEKEAALAERKDRLALLAKNITVDLLHVGVEVRGIGSRFKSYQDNVTALPVLAKHLTVDYPDALREAIARAMAIQEATPYRSLAVELFKDLTGASVGFRYGLGMIIAETTNQSNLGETFSLLRDTKLGIARMALLPALKGRRKLPQVADLLKELGNDSDLAKEISAW